MAAGKLVLLNKHGHTEVAYTPDNYKEAENAFVQAIRGGVVGVKTKDGVSSMTKAFDPTAETHEGILPLVGG